MVLVTPLELQVQEDKASGRVRVNATDSSTGGYPKDVHVKVIGSENRDFVSGETDLRGIFVADGIRGVATVIARDSKGQFAFHRGSAYLGEPVRRGGARGRAEAQQEVDYLSNVRDSNYMYQHSRQEGQKALYMQRQKGVQVDQMMQ
jgi:hypothetical protein